MRSFILSAFLSRRKPEDHEVPRIFAVPHHRDLTERIIGLAIEVHRHTGPALQESVYAAVFCTNCRPLRRTGTGWYFDAAPGGHSGDPPGKPLPLGFHADILADETVIQEIKAVPALLPAHDSNRPMMTRPSSRAVGMRTGLVGRRAKTQLQT